MKCSTQGGASALHTAHNGCGFNSFAPHAPDLQATALADADPHPMTQDTLPEPGADTALRCFVVEDSPLIRQNLVATLEEMLAVRIVGFAEDERGAVEWLQQGVECELMIIDIFLKSGTGLEVLRQARLARPRVQLVVLTNYATADMRRRCIQLGADRVFDKSAELEELLAYCEELAASGRGA